jgi:hypothetical protein
VHQVVQEALGLSHASDFDVWEVNKKGLVYSVGAAEETPRTDVDLVKEWIAREPDWKPELQIEHIKPQGGQTETPAFNAWFKNSKVVDERGRPLVVYHGTDASGFTQFERTEDIGFHFGTQSQANERAGEEGGNVISAYLRIEHPLRLPDLGTWDPDDVVRALADADVLSQAQADLALSEDTLIDRDFVAGALKAKGYDGIVYLNMSEGGIPTEARGGFTREEPYASLKKRFPEAEDSYIVFDPTQIKSAIGNKAPSTRRAPASSTS